MNPKLSDEIKPSTNLKSLRFRQEREADWSRLESLVNTYEKKGVGGLSNEDMLAAPVLYRSTLSGLSVARSTTLDKGVIDYLESLCARGYFFIYGSRATLFDKISSFLRTEWHEAAKALWRETLVSGVLFAVGVIIAFALYAQSTEWFFAFMPEDLAGGRDPTASVESLRATLYDNAKLGEEGLSVFATFLFTHNAKVALLSFAVGFAFGIPSAILMIMNGAVMGVFVALFASQGLGFEVGGWLAIHGVTEILAFTIAGGAGLNLGRAMAFPGEQSRMASLAKAGTTSGVAMAGSVVMLIVAGLLEGIGRQTITNDYVRYGIGICSGVIWLVYLYAPRGKKVSAP